MRNYADIVREFRVVLSIVECGSPSVAAQASARLPGLTSELLAASSRAVRSSSVEVHKWRVHFWLQYGRNCEPRLTATVEATNGGAAVAYIMTHYGQIELDEVELVSE